MAKTTNISGEIRKRRWNWIGHIRKDPLCCGSRVDAWGKKEEGTPKDNVVTDGGGRKKQDGMELLEHSAQRGFKSQYVESKCPSLMCIMVRRELIWTHLTIIDIKFYSNPNLKSQTLNKEHSLPCKRTKKQLNNIVKPARQQFTFESRFPVEACWRIPNHIVYNDKDNKLCVIN